MLRPQVHCSVAPNCWRMQVSVDIGRVGRMLQMAPMLCYRVTSIMAELRILPGVLQQLVAPCSVDSKFIEGVEQSRAGSTGTAGRLGNFAPFLRLAPWHCLSYKFLPRACTSSFSSSCDCTPPFPCSRVQLLNVMLTLLSSYFIESFL